MLNLCKIGPPIECISNDLIFNKDISDLLEMERFGNLILVLTRTTIELHRELMREKDQIFVNLQTEPLVVQLHGLLNPKLLIIGKIALWDQQKLIVFDKTLELEATLYHDFLAFRVEGNECYCIEKTQALKKYEIMPVFPYLKDSDLRHSTLIHKLWSHIFSTPSLIGSIAIGKYGQVATLVRDELTIFKPGTSVSFSEPGISLIQYWETGELMLIKRDTGKYCLFNTNVDVGPIKWKDLPIEVITVNAVSSDSLFISSAAGLYCLFTVGVWDLINFHITNFDFQKAISIGLDNHYDTDVVYQFIFQTQISYGVADIGVLDKVTNIKWVLQQCKITLGSTLETHKLIKFAIGLTESLTPEKVYEEIDKIMESDFTSPSPALDLFFARIEFLNRNDLLNTFEILFEREILTEGNSFVSRALPSFLDNDILAIASEAAKKGKPRVLQALLQRHPGLHKYRLALIQLIPPSVSPEEYCSILPRLVGNEITALNSTPWRHLDWTESLEMMEFYTLFHPKSYVIENNAFPETVEAVEAWYRLIIEKLVENGNAASALIILRNARMPNLDSLASEIEISEASRFTLSQLRQSNHLDIVSAIIQGTTLNIFKYLQKMRKMGYILEKEQILPLLRKNLSNKRILVNFQEIVDMPEIRTFISFKDLIEAYPYSDFVSMELLEQVSLNLADYEQNIDSITDEDKKAILELVKHVKLAKFLNNHGVPLSLSECKTWESTDCFYKLKTVIENSELLHIEEKYWYETLIELLEMQQSQYLFNITTDQIYEIMVSHALKSQNYSFAQNIIFPKETNHMLKSDLVDRIIYETAVDMIDGDLVGNKNQNLLKEAVKCCNIVKPTGETRILLDLIDAIHELCTVHSVRINGDNLIPATIRQSKKKFIFIEALLSTKSTLYQKSKYLEDLASKLRLDRSISQFLVAKAALNVGDLKVARENVDTMINSFSVGSNTFTIPFCRFLLALADQTVLFDYLVGTFLAGSALRLVPTIALEELETNFGALLTIAKCDEALQGVSKKAEGNPKKLLMQIDAEIQKITSSKEIAAVDINRFASHDFIASVQDEINGNYQYRTRDFHLASMLEAQMALVIQYDPTNHQLRKDIYWDLGRFLLRIDVILATSCLLMAEKDIWEYEEFFSSVQGKADTLCALQAYFYTSLYQYRSNQNEKFLITDVKNPENLINRIQFNSTNNGEIVKMIHQFQGEWKKLKKSANVDIFHRLRDVEYHRLETDPGYKKGLVLKLAETSNQKEFESALSLAEESGISRQEFIAMHFLWIWDIKHDYGFIDSNLKKLQSSKVVDLTCLWSCIPSCHLIVQERGNRVIQLFYNFLLEINSQQLYLVEADQLQIKLRLNIVQELIELKLDDKIKLTELKDIGIEKDDVMNYVKLLRLSLQDTILLIKDWLMISPLDILGESNFIDSDLRADRINDVASIIIESYMKETNWATFKKADQSIQLHAVVDVLPLLNSNFAKKVVDDLVNGKWKSYFSPSMRLFVLEKGFSLNLTSEGIDDKRKHLGFLHLVQNLVDEIGIKVITPALLHNLDTASGLEPKLIEILHEMVLDGYSPFVLESLASAVLEYYGHKLELTEIYQAAVKMALISDRDVKLLQSIVDSLASNIYSPVYDIKFEDDGWGVDDFDICESPIVSPNNDFPELSQFSIRQTEMLRTMIEKTLLESDTILPTKKLRLLQFFEKNFKDLRSPHSTITESRHSTLIEAVWGISLPDHTNDPKEKFRFLLANTSDAKQIFQLAEFVFEWKLDHSPQIWLELLKYLVAEEHFPLLYVFQYLVAELFDEEICDLVLAEFGLNFMDTAEMYIYKVLFYKEKRELVFHEVNNQIIDCIDYRYFFRLTCSMELQEYLSKTYQSMMKSMLIKDEQDAVFASQYLVRYPKERADVVLRRFQLQEDLTFVEFVDMQHEIVTASIENSNKPIFFESSPVEKIAYLQQIYENGLASDLYVLLEFSLRQKRNWSEQELAYMVGLDYIRAGNSQ